jgi:hypothetical protein
MAKFISNTTPELAVTLAFQGRMADKKAELSKSKVALDDQKKQLAIAHSFEDVFPALSHKREDVLAAMVVGTATARELAVVETEIDEATKLMKAHQAAHAETYRDGAGIIAGLNRKIAEVQAEIAAMSDQYRNVLAEFLRSEAERIGADYMASAQSLMVNLRQLFAIGYIEKANGTGLCLAELDRHTLLSLPCFEQLESVKSAGDQVFLFDAETNKRGTAWLNGEVEKEVSRLLALNVRLMDSPGTAGLVY